MKPRKLVLPSVSTHLQVIPRTGLARVGEVKVHTVHDAAFDVSDRTDNRLGIHFIAICHVEI